MKTLLDKNNITLFIYLLTLITIFWPFLYESFHTDKKSYKNNNKLRAIKIVKLDDSFFFIIQQKLYFTNWFRFYGKWYGISEDNSGFAVITKYKTLEEAENRIKKLVKESNEYNEKRHNNKVKHKEVVIITK